MLFSPKQLAAQIRCASRSPTAWDAEMKGFGSQSGASIQSVSAQNLASVQSGLAQASRLGSCCLGLADLSH